MESVGSHLEVHVGEVEIDVHFRSDSHVLASFALSLMVDWHAVVGLNQESS